MRHGSLVLVIIPLVALGVGCGSGEVIWTGDGGQDGSGDCPGGCPSGTRCAGGACVPDDPCGLVRCNADEVCRDGRCVPTATDTDGDGWTAGDDCDDYEETVYPGAAESCNGRDDDCDGDVDEGFDEDRDGHSSCGSGLPDTADCDDADPGVHPGAGELCNGRDDDCDGDVDEDIGTRPCASTCGEGTERCERGAWVCDVPETCDCTAVGEVDSEDCGLCGTRTRLCEADHGWGPWSDCEGEGVCAPDAVEAVPCELCGTRRRTCRDDCTWGVLGPCEGTRACEPGDVDGTECDACSQQVCAADCRWGPCDLRPTSECEWRSGTHFRCCGYARWQYCLRTCLWSTDCASCSCSSCGPCC